MTKKKIFFDIDGTLFDAKSLLLDLFSFIQTTENLKDDETELVKKIYTNTKNELGYFNPEEFINRLKISFKNISSDKIHKFLFSKSLDRYLFADVSILKDLSEKFILGIFSKGDYDFQKNKLENIKNLLNKSDIHIFTNKINHSKEIINLNLDSRLLFVDDDISVLENLNLVSDEINLILINRKNLYNNPTFKTIRSLEELSKYE